MVKNTEHMRKNDVLQLIKKGEIRLGGHRPQKLYGRFDCKSAAKFVRQGTYVKGRVFFTDEAEAIAEGYRPCAKCLPRRYQVWKDCKNASQDYTQELAQILDEVVELASI